MEKEKDHISQPPLLGYMAGFRSREHEQKWYRAAYKSIRISRPISLPPPPHAHTPLPRLPGDSTRLALNLNMMET